MILIVDLILTLHMHFLIFLPCTSMSFDVGEVLGSKIALKYHGQAKHSNVREFSCHICGKNVQGKSLAFWYT